LTFYPLVKILRKVVYEKKCKIKVTILPIFWEKMKTINQNSNHPSTESVYPIKEYKNLVFLKNIIKNPNIEIGDFTYYDNQNPLAFEEEAVLYHFDFVGDKLIIGKFCMIASKTLFIMNGGNHNISGFSAYPFGIFGEAWASHMQSVVDAPNKGDTCIENDVWIGHGAVIMPGIKIGNGAIIGARSVVTKNVEPYSIVAGNPAMEIRKRFDDKTINRLLELRWWDMDYRWITDNLSLISGKDIVKLEESIKAFKQFA